jgi:acyl-CoA dehydrogenase
VPLTETLTAGWLLAQAGLDAPEGAMTVAPARPRDRIMVNSDDTLDGRARHVPFARDVEHMAVQTQDGSVALVAAGDCDFEDAANLAGDSAATVIFDGVVPRACARNIVEPNSLLRFGAVVRSVQMAGALETVLALSVRYANERVAFERRIGKFQAVQQNLAKLAGETAAALAAAGSAADTIAHDGIDADALMLEAASAKIRAGEAAAEGAAIAHQVHGAIGFTNEHVLHRFTLRLLSWRDDFGSESYWAAQLGGMVAQRGGDNFWPLLASR